MPRHLTPVATAVADLAAHPDPAALADGLSEPMARHCLGMACGLLDRASLDRATRVPGRPPRVAAVVAARGVFTAPLEWVGLLAAVGAEVILKVPASAPAFGDAVAASFQARGLPVTATTARDLPAVEALVAMGGDEAMAALAARHHRARLLLHSHRFSVAVVRGSDPDLARALAEDALLYDGRGCFTPVAVFHLGSPGASTALARHLGEAMVELRRRLPAGAIDPLHGPRRRLRAGLARLRGGLYGQVGAAAAVLPAATFEPAALPGFLPVHPVADLAEVAALLAPWRPHLAACATDLALDPGALGFERLCRPGDLQRPPLPRTHGGREMLRPLMHHPSHGELERP
ncbi:MAG: acyl-CoA reductase [Pseudomonadota bacterium]